MVIYYLFREHNKCIGYPRFQLTGIIEICSYQEEARPDANALRGYSSS